MKITQLRKHQIYPDLIRNMSDLPAQQGFKFTGVRKGGSTLPCEVRIAGRDQVFLTDLRGRIVTNELTGWLTI